MAQFAYKARRRSGEIVQDVVDAPDRAAALMQIERLGLFPMMVDGGGKGNAPVAAASSNGAKSGEAKSSGDILPNAFKQVFRRKRKPKLQELATFTQQLRNLLK